MKPKLQLKAKDKTARREDLSWNYFGNKNQTVIM
jgi:hypothetical protein